MSVLPTSQNIEAARAFWAGVAKENGWYSEPFFIQAWVDDSGQIIDSVSHQGLEKDCLLDENDLPL